MFTFVCQTVLVSSLTLVSGLALAESPPPLPDPGAYEWECEDGSLFQLRINDQATVEDLLVRLVDANGRREEGHLPTLYVSGRPASYSHAGGSYVGYTTRPTGTVYSITAGAGVGSLEADVSATSAWRNAGGAGELRQSTLGGKLLRKVRCTSTGR